MSFVQTEPKWDLVTNVFNEPQNFTDLLSLLTPERPKGEGKQRVVLTWKEKEFYKEENLASFIVYGMDKVNSLSKFHKDELSTLVRIVRLCQEIGWYTEANIFMMNQGLYEFVKTSLQYETWDVITKVVAWNYLIVKYKIGKLEEIDVAIWEKIKFDEECVEQYGELLSQKEMMEFMFFFLCKQAKSLTREQLDSDIMSLAIYCNKYVYDLYIY